MLAGAAATLLATPVRALAASKIAVRVWPDDDCTRIFVESSKKLSYSHMILRTAKPYRLVLDLQGVQMTPVMQKNLQAIQSRDRFIASIRAGQFKPDVLRIVFELRSDVSASVHYAKPVENFGHRIILDLSPTNADVMKKLIDASDRDFNKAASKTTAERKPAEPNKVRETTSRTQTKPAKRSGKTETLVVVIDAGHGGEDPGAVGRNKTREKDVVLAIAKKLEADINRTRGMRAVMTRSKDVFLPLHKRAEVAVKNKAHLFISIHADAWTNTDAKGSSVYILSTGEATSLQARWLAQTQNKADEIGGVSFQGIDKSAHVALIDLQADAKLTDSTRLAGKLLTELAKVGPLHKSSIEQAEFAVLKARGIASVLVETAFLSNPAEEHKLRDSRQQARMAKALLDGVRTFWRQYPNITKTL